MPFVPLRYTPDYLLKPFDHERFDAAWARVKEQIKLDQTGERDQHILALLEELKADHDTSSGSSLRQAAVCSFLRCRMFTASRRKELRSRLRQPEGLSLARDDQQSRGTTRPATVPAHSSFGNCQD